MSGRGICYINTAEFYRATWGFGCVYCHTIERKLHCDHIVPRLRGGRSTMDNLATSCATCNQEKHARTSDEWGAGA